MSFVICSNQVSDEATQTQTQSVFKPYSFRNQMSETMVIPENSEVAVQSVKYNLDGRVALSTRGSQFYNYVGENASEDDEEGSMRVSTSTPTLARIVGDDIITPSSVAERLQETIRDTIYHPNLRKTLTVAEKRDATSNAFEGYTITYDNFSGSTAVVPDSAHDGFRLSRAGQSLPTYANYNATTGAFSSEVGATGPVDNVAIFDKNPISLAGGSIVFDFSNLNGTGLGWAVGLRRPSNTTDFGFLPDGIPAGTGLLQGPSYYDPEVSENASGRFIGGSADGWNGISFFYDYLVGRENDGTLRVYHTTHNSSEDFGHPDQLVQSEVEYYDTNASSDYSSPYDLTTNSDGLVSIKFICEGERVIIKTIDNGGTEAFLLDFKGTSNATDIQAKPINIANWDMYPIAYIETSDSAYGNTITLGDYIPSNTAHTNHAEGSWWGSTQGNARLNELARQIEMRPWNDFASAGTDGIFASYYGVTAGVIDFPKIGVIVDESNLYTPSVGADASSLLGLSGDSFATSQVLESDSVPSLTSNEAMFIRLDSIAQGTTINAHLGNKTRMLAHVPAFQDQVKTGRVYFEPSERVYVSLDNPNPIRISSIDLSVVRINEAYALNLQGQTIICLHFRRKK